MVTVAESLDVEQGLYNPYLDAVRATGDVDEDASNPRDVGLEPHDDLVEEYAWAIPNESAIRTIAEYGPILEVGAGAGYWAMLLRQVGVDVVATDPAAPVDPAWSPVEPLAAREAVEEYPDRTLLTVWPSEDETWAAEALHAYDGDTCIYVGEPPGGCTADKHFHHLLQEGWEREGMVGIPQYRGVNDRLEVWVRPDHSLSLLTLPGMETLLHGE